ncbi:hypothetical protein ABIA33_004539 [Streptacidiphilus sp. MAP12-16]|uniref:hypothetical protein n=1 Tax=Streptacidiphilus sp. MAP12-16 TaxID=3156300 RepID=UPI00351146B4
MSSQGASASGGADGSWWDAVYAGPGDEVPDTPRADSRPGTVDDWFDTASGMIGGAADVQDAEQGPAEAPAEAPAVGPETNGPPTLVDEPVRKPAVPEQPLRTQPPVMPPLPRRPPRVPPLTPDPRVVAPRTPEPRTPEPRTPAPRTPAPRAAEPADRYDGDVFEDDGYDGYDGLEGFQGRDDEREPQPPIPAPASGTSSAPTTAVTEPLPHVGERPPTYEPEPTALPAADPDRLAGLVPDTALDGARYGTMTLRAASIRGDSARHRGESRADRLLTVRFGEGSEALLLVAFATPPHAEDPAVADEACRQLAAAVGRSRTELLADLRVGAQERLRYGLQRLTARAALPLQRSAGQVGGAGGGAGGALHALIAPLDPTSRLRAGFGLGPGGLLLLGDDAWYDAYAGRRLVSQQGAPDTVAQSAAAQEPDRFRFRVVVPEPGDVLLLCSDGLAQPLREEPAVSDFLADHWAHPHPPGTVDFLRHVQVRAKGYAADRTAAAIWED